jgi:iron complex transport system ATP-binding protein
VFIPPPIETRALSIGYTLRGNLRRVVHSGLDLQLYAGGVTCLLGRNGSGKSTLLRTLCGLLKPLSGEIILDGRPLESYSPEERASKVGVVLTDRDFPGAISVYELVSMGRYPHTDFFGSLDDDDHAVVRESIEMVGLTDKSDRLLAELSDGERQKAYIAKALAQECPVILLDEPTAFLDVPSRLETWETLKRLARVRQKAILLTTHDLESAIRTADLLWLLPEATVTSSSGALISGKPGEMVADGTVDKFFGTHISRTLI